MSIATVITRGFGSFGSVAGVVLMGYDQAETAMQIIHFHVAQPGRFVTARDADGGAMRRSPARSAEARDAQPGARPRAR